MEFRFRAGEMESLPFFDCPPPPPPPLPSPNLFPRKPMQGSVNPRPSLEELEKELKEEKIREEITACRIAQRRMIEEQVRREMEIGHEGSFPSMELLDQKLTTTEKTANTKISNTTFKFLRPEQEDISSHLAKAPLFSSIETSTNNALVKEDCGYTGSILTPAVAANKPEGLEVHACSEENVTIQVNGKSYEIVEKGIYLLCSLCGVQCSNRDVMASHLSGKKHLLKEWRKGNKPEAAESEAVEEEKYDFKEVNKNWICDLCQVEFPGKVGLSDHLRGKKHRAKSASASDKPAKSAEVEDKNGSSSMPMDTCGGTKVSTKEENLSLLKREASDEEKLHVKEVNGIWICNICQVIVPGPDKEGFNIHLTGKKHKAKSTSARASNDCANSTTEEDNDDSSWMPMDMQGGTTMSTKFESVTLLKREGLEEEKYHVKEVNKIWICDLCQVIVPGPDKEGFYVHLIGKKHLAKSALARVSNELPKSAAVEGNNGPSSMSMDTEGGTKVRTNEEHNLALLKKEALEEKYHVKQVNNIWICDLCQVNVPSPDLENFNVHLKGKKHQAKLVHLSVINDLAKLAAVEDNNGSSSMPTDAHGGIKVSAYKEEEQLSFLKEALEEKYHAKEVNNIWICDLCKVNVPRPDSDGFKDHLRGKKHKAKLEQLSVINEPAKSATIEYKHCCVGSSLMPMDIQEGTEVSVGVENSSLVKKKAIEEGKYYVTEVKETLISHLCQVEMPIEGFNVHLGGKKHQVKTVPLIASIELSNSIIKDNNGCSGSSSMPIDAPGGIKESTEGEGNSSLVKKEATEEEKYLVKEVTKNWICDICQVSVPRPGTEGFNAHLRGRKHRVKSDSNKLTPLAALGDTLGCDGSSLIQIDTKIINRG